MIDSTAEAPTPPRSLGQRVRDAIGIDLDEIAGTTVSGEIPIVAGAINRLIAARLAASTGPVEAVTIAPRDGNALTALVRLRTRMVPPLTVDIRIEQQPQMPERPVIGLRWTLPKLGALALLAGPAIALFTNSLPRGISAQGDWVAVDVYDLMRSRGLGEFVPYLRDLRVTTRENIVIVQFQLRG